MTTPGPNEMENDLGPYKPTMPGFLGQEPTRDVSGGHFVEFQIGSYGYLSVKFECREPDTRDCHQIDDDGVPTTRVRTCNFVEWMEAVDDGLDYYFGPDRKIQNGPIWVHPDPIDGEGYVWTLPGDDPKR